MYLSLYFPLVSPPKDTGSSHNVLIMAKGEPLTVLAAPHKSLYQKIIDKQAKKQTQVRVNCFFDAHFIITRKVLEYSSGDKRACSMEHALLSAC